MDSDVAWVADQGSRDRRAALTLAQRAQVAHNRRLIVLFEGPDGAGKHQVLRALAAVLDPCHFVVHRISRERREAAEGHWLARFWRQLPAAGQTVFFLRSWYRRVLDDRLEGRVEGAGLARAFDEINEFEAQQRDYGTPIVKLFFDVDSATQRVRLAERERDPWRAADEPSLDVTDPRYAQAIEDLRDNSDTRWSPWVFIDGADPDRAADQALQAVLKVCQEAFATVPPHPVASGERAA